MPDVQPRKSLVMPYTYLFLLDLHSLNPDLLTFRAGSFLYNVPGEKTCVRLEPKPLGVPPALSPSNDLHSRFLCDLQTITQPQHCSRQCLSDLALA